MKDESKDEMELYCETAKVPVKSELVFEVHRAQIINVTPARETMTDMLAAGIKAAQELKKRNQAEFKVNIEIGGGLNVPKIAERNHLRFMQIALDCRSKKKPVKELSEEEKFAICVACDVPVEMVAYSENHFGAVPLVSKLQTRHPCAIVLEDGQYAVYYSKA